MAAGALWPFLIDDVEQQMSWMGGFEPETPDREPPPADAGRVPISRTA